MNVRHTLICFFFLSLQDENTGLINAQITVFTRIEGGDVTVKCPFSYYGSRKLFCREECKQKDVLIDTTRDEYQSGRYSTEYRAGSLSVSITQLTKSDSGLYRCGLGSSYHQFRIIVVDAWLDGNALDVTTIYKRPGGNIIVGCVFTDSLNRKYFCKDECEEKDILVETTGVRVQKDRYSIEFTKGFSSGYLYVSITQLTKSDSGLYRCGLGTTRSTRSSNKQFRIIVVDAWLDRNAPEVTTIYERPGGNIVVGCVFTDSLNRKYFCKDECEEKDILVETTGVRVQNDRYSFEFIKGFPTGGSLYASITQLTKSDSGLYRCGSGITRPTRSSNKQLRIIVVDAWLDRNAPEVTTIYERPGGNIVVGCFFIYSGNRKYFCKDECEEKDILVETTGVRVQKDRYSIEFIKGSPTGGSLYVNITQLTKSDSGMYWCGLDIFLSQDPFRKFNIIVTDPNTSKPPPAFTTPVPSASTLTSTQSDQQQSETTPSTDVWLYVGLTLAVMVVLLALAVLIYCRKRSSEPKEPRGETEYACVTEANRVYEDIREDRQNAAPMELSSVYAGYAKNGVDEDNFDAAASSENTADSSKLTYSELNFSNRTAGSSNSAICGDRDNVVYSVPRVEANAVYSTVS